MEGGRGAGDELPSTGGQSDWSRARHDVGVILGTLAFTGVLIAVLVNFPAAWRVHQGTGVTGSFTAAGVCDKGYCPGRFVSDDGHVVRDPVELFTDFISMVDRVEVRAIDVGDIQVYKDADQVPLVSDVLFVAGAAFALAMWIRIRLRKRTNASGSAPTSGGVTLPT